MLLICLIGTNEEDMDNCGDGDGDGVGGGHGDDLLDESSDERHLD